MENYDLPTDNQSINPPNPEEQKPHEAKEPSPFRTFLKQVGHFIYEILTTTAIIVVVAFLIRFFVIQPFVVEGESMEPNFHNNEYLIIQKVTGYFSDYSRGDVIVFKYPNNPEISYIKRIVALPSEKIKIENQQATIFNSDHPQGSKLDEDYLLTDRYKTQGVIEKILGPDEYFVMGDNRDNSSDSREWGVLNKKFIQGKLLVTIYPFSDFGFYHDPQYQF